MSYTPHLFCFQGKSWAGSDFSATGITWPGPPKTLVEPPADADQWVIDWFKSYNTVIDTALNPASPNAVQKEIASAVNWSKENNRPLWMSEFTDQNGADLISRTNWIKCVRTELEKKEIPWSFWTLFSDP